MDHIRNDHDTIENTDHFCGFLLQMWSERGRKDYFRLEFNAKTLTECPNPRRYCIYSKTPRNTGALDLRMGSIRVVNGISVWIFRQKSCGVSVHASILPESHQ